MSRLQVLHPWRRTVFNWIVLPAASVGSLALLPLLFGLLVSLARNPAPLGWWLLGIAVIASVIVSKRLATWVIADPALRIVATPTRCANTATTRSEACTGSADEPVKSELSTLPPDTKSA
jgi:hypothetical protein